MKINRYYIFIFVIIIILISIYTFNNDKSKKVLMSKTDTIYLSELNTNNNINGKYFTNATKLSIDGSIYTSNMDYDSIMSNIKYIDKDNITELYIYNYGLDNIKFITEFKNLQILSITFSSKITNIDEFFKNELFWKNITGIRLAQCENLNVDINDISDFTNLTYLHINDTYNTSEKSENKINSLDALSNNLKLESININNTDITGNIDFIMNFPNLDNILLAKTNFVISDEMIEYLDSKEVFYSIGDASSFLGG